MALSRNRALRITFAATFFALMAIGAGAAILVGHANPIIVFATVGMVLGAMIFGAIRPKWAQRAESLWIPADGIGLALWVISGGTRTLREHADWERSAFERRDRIARAQAAGIHDRAA
jgi:hypothetical protein